MLVDTGASVNVIDETTFNWMRGRMSPALHLAPSHVRLYPYGAKTPFPVMGEFKAETTSCSTSTSTTARFIVVRGNSGCLLGRETAPELKLIHMAEDQNQSQSASAVHIDTRSPDRVEDGLSRLPIPGQASGERSIAEEHISEILTSAIPRAMSKQDIALATKDDGELQKVIKNVQTNKWEKSDAFYKIRLELAVKDNVLLRGKRIVIPKTLRKRTLDIVHEAHQGIVRLKQALRTKVWWPNIDHDAEVLVRSCRPCQSEAPPPPSEPLHPSPMPPSPWHTVHMDLCGPLPTGETLLVVIDSATRWPEVEIIRSTTTITIVSRLRRIFACHGYPTRVVTDNAPQFVSQEFKDFLRDAGIDHRRVTPYHPEANAAVERFNATLVSAIRKAREDGKDWKEALPTFLLTYRTTPHPATKSTPSRLTFNRDLRTKMPNIREPRVTIEVKKAAEEDDKYKDKIKTRAKSGNKSKSDINVGDHVVIRQPHINKFSTRYDTNPWIVIAKKGGSVKIQRGKYITMRYSSQMRKIPTPHYTRHKNAHDNDDELEFDNTPRENRDRDIGPNLHDREQSRRSQRQSRPPERLT